MRKFEANKMDFTFDTVFKDVRANCLRATLLRR